MNYLRDKRLLQKHDGLSPAEIDEMPYWEFIEYRNLLAADLKREAEQARTQRNHQEKSSPKMPKVSMPRIPKFR